MFLLLFGLGLSIPFIVFTSNLLSMLMDKYPAIIYIGAAILGKVGGEMMITDPFTLRLLPEALLTIDRLHPLPLLQYSIEVFFAAGVIAAGKIWMGLAVRREGKEAILMQVEQKPAGTQRPNAVLTVSREFGSGGREIGRAVAGALGYRYVDRDLILAEIRKDGPKWEQWARDLDEHCPTVWEKYDWSYRGFAALMQLHILEQAEQGGVVIMGRGGNFLLKDVPHAYRIRVTARLEDRMERVVKRESVDRDTARWLCEKTDNERACFLHAIYGGRWDDPAEYDRVFLVKDQSVDAEVAAITGVLRNMPVAGDAVRSLRIRTAAAKVRAGIATNPKFFIPVFDRGRSETPRRGGPAPVRTALPEMIVYVF
jgi:hypothetical protein